MRKWSEAWEKIAKQGRCSQEEEANYLCTFGVKLGRHEDTWFKAHLHQVTPKYRRALRKDGAWRETRRVAAKRDMTSEQMEKYWWFGWMVGIHGTHLVGWSVLHVHWSCLKDQLWDRLSSFIHGELNCDPRSESSKPQMSKRCNLDKPFYLWQIWSDWLWHSGPEVEKPSPNPRHPTALQR